MASSSKGHLIGRIRYCSRNSSYYYEMHYYAQLFWDESYDSQNNLTCSNFRCQFSRTGQDHGYYSYCGSEDGIATGGTCPNSGDSLYCLNNINGFTFVNQGTIATNRWAMGSATLGTHSISGTLTIKPGGSICIDYAYGASCQIYDYARACIYNNRTTPQPVAPTLSPSGSCSNSSYSSLSFSAGGSYGTCPSGQSNSTTYTVYDVNGNSIKSGSGTSVSVTGLQANSYYSCTFYRSNGCSSVSRSASAVTSAGCSISEATATSTDTGTCRIVPIYGGGYYKTLTHQIQIARYGYSDWKTVATSNATAPTVVSFSGLTEEQTYQIRVITSNGSGCTYTSTGPNFTTPAKGVCTAEFTSVDSDINNSCTACWADICYRYETNMPPADIKVYYRVKDGYDPEWKLADSRTVTKESGDVCFRIEGLYPNQVTYELLIRTHTEQQDWEGDIKTFTTPLCPEATSDTCESLTYMTEYLCASIKRIREGGNMKVFANPYSQQLCEPGSTAPTNLTLWSRFLRLNHAYLCLICDLVNLAHASSDQYLVGEIGWVTMLKEIREEDMATDGWKLATSDATYEYIERKIKEVWHYQGTVDVMVKSKSDLNNYPNAKSAIVTDENAIYTKSGSTWTKSEEEPEDFGVWHINQDSDVAKAESGWYYWGGTWHNLDDELQEIAARLEEIEQTFKDAKPVYRHREHVQLQVVDTDFPCEDMVEGVTYIVVEKEEESYDYNTVTFEVGEGQPKVAKQKVLVGGHAQEPTVQPTDDDCDFGGWYKDGDEPPTCPEGFIPKNK